MSGSLVKTIKEANKRLLVDADLDAIDEYFQEDYAWNGTGAFMGFPASNRDVVWRDMVTSRFEDGKIAEEWAVSDLAEGLLLARKD